MCPSLIQFRSADSSKVYTYTTDCYKPQSAEIGAVINLYKSVVIKTVLMTVNQLTSQQFAFTIGFYAVPFGEHSGWNVSFPVLAMINGVTIFPLIYLWFRGEQVREKQGIPRIHEDL